jgi:hypothetical protein
MQGQGKILYDDYIENEPGALQDLQKYLNGPAYRTRTALERSQHPTAPGSGHSHTSTGRSTWARRANSGDIADQVYANSIGSAGGRFQEDVELGEISTRTLYLLSGMENGKHGTKLSRELVTHIIDDRQLFHTLRRIYHESRGRLRPYWSLRTLHSIHFMKVRKAPQSDENRDRTILTAQNSSPTGAIDILTSDVMITFVSPESLVTVYLRLTLSNRREQNTSATQYLQSCLRLSDHG